MRAFSDGKDNDVVQRRCRHNDENAINYLIVFVCRPLNATHRTKWTRVNFVFRRMCVCVWGVRAFGSFHRINYGCALQLTMNPETHLDLSIVNDGEISYKINVWKSFGAICHGSFESIRWRPHHPLKYWINYLCAKINLTYDSFTFTFTTQWHIVSSHFLSAEKERKNTPQCWVGWLSTVCRPTNGKLKIDSPNEMHVAHHRWPSMRRHLAFRTSHFDAGPADTSSPVCVFTTSNNDTQ